MKPDRPGPPSASRLPVIRQDEHEPPEAPLPAVPGHNFASQRRTLIALLVATVVLPCVYVAVMAYNDLRQREATTRNLVQRTVRVAEEHALKVFDMNETLNARVVDLVQGLDDAGIEAREAAIHERLRSIGGGYPQVAAVSIFNRDGRLLASSNHYPVTPLSIARREDFVGIRDDKVIEHISRLMTSSLSGESVFNTGVARRGADGEFEGMVSVALRTSYFTAFYRDLLGEDSPALAVGITREDGAILAQYPTPPHLLDSITPRSPFARGLSQGRPNGVVHMYSKAAGADVMLAYRRVGGYPVYVSCGYRMAAMWAGWYRHLALLVLSMFTPSILLWGVIVLSLRRLRAEEEAWERWQAEAAMRRSLEATYRQSRKMEALGNLVGSVAHDFNNLLMIISANVQIARRRGAAGLERELAAIERALKSGQSLTRQLLGVARKQPLHNATLLPARWLPACRELLRASLGAKVSLVMEVDEAVWPIRVDAAELELALINLAVNARDAMPSGGRFTIRAANVVLRREDGFPLDGEFVQLSLEDTGSGMTPEVLSHAFEPLFTTKPKGMGTGLGLPQVFAFCERSGGLAALDSAIGAGTSVHLYLPRAAEAPPPERAAETRHATGAAPHGLAILLVEDNDEVAAGTEALLRLLGHHVTHAHNADLALRLLDEARARQREDGAPRPFDLVLSDIDMPGRANGLDVAEAAQAFEPRLPVILVTGYAEELERTRSVDVRVLAKPFDVALLERMLREIEQEMPSSQMANQG